jgi:hypothetical protein
LISPEQVAALRSLHSFPTGGKKRARRWRTQDEAPCSKLQGIKRNCAEAYPPSLYELRRGRLAIHPCSKLQGILAKANKP